MCLANVFIYDTSHKFVYMIFLQCGIKNNRKCGCYNIFLKTKLFAVFVII